MQLARRIRALERTALADLTAAIERELARLRLTPEEQEELMRSFEAQREIETRHAAKATHPRP